MGKRSWSDEQLVQSVKVSRSRRQVLGLLGLQPKGGNYETVKKRISTLNIDTSHFLGMGWSKGTSRPSTQKISLEDILISNSTYQSHKLKARLIKANILPAFCMHCGWCERSIDGRLPLELDHINGIHNDNRLENLRILCSNCHRLQATHRGRNRKK